MGRNGYWMGKKYAAKIKGFPKSKFSVKCFENGCYACVVDFRSLSYILPGLYVS